MDMQGPRRLRLIRWLLAAWLVAWPWVTHAAQQMPLGDAVNGGVEMPCHTERSADTAESSDPDCPHCAGDTLAPCKCCSFATAAALLTLEVGTHFLSASSEPLLLPRAIRPPADHPEPLYRPPILRSV